MGWQLHSLFNTLRRNLAVPLPGKDKPEELLRVNRAKVESFIPHYWPEEAKSLEEWFIRIGRSLGFHISWDAEHQRFDVRLTKNAMDEATITWPGRDNMSAGASTIGKEWSNDRPAAETSPDARGR